LTYFTIAAQNSILPSKPPFKSSTPHRTPQKTPRRSPLDSVYATPVRTSTPPSASKSRTPTGIKKWGSMTNSTELNGANSQVRYVTNSVDINLQTR